MRRRCARGAALVDVQVRGLGADDGLVGAEGEVEAGDVGAGAVEDEKGLGMGAEVAAEEIFGARGELISAVGGGVAFVHRRDRSHDVGVDARVVVRGEVVREAHGCSWRRAPFIFCAASEQR